jgi:hypothetical protein
MGPTKLLQLIYLPLTLTPSPLAACSLALTTHYSCIPVDSCSPVGHHHDPFVTAAVGRHRNPPRRLSARKEKETWKS